MRINKTNKILVEPQFTKKAVVNWNFGKSKSFASHQLFRGWFIFQFARNIELLIKRMPTHRVLCYGLKFKRKYIDSVEQ